MTPDNTTIAQALGNKKTLAGKLELVLSVLGYNRASFAKAAGIRPETLSRLIPSDRRPPERTAYLATVQRIIDASQGMLTVQDFQRHGVLRVRLYELNTCPLCGHALPQDGDAGDGGHVRAGSEEQRQAA